MARQSEITRLAGDRSQMRCAIYTRKSSEEGLDQAFNSLDAQRETCEAYIASQKHEGWVALPQMYDDGGISGGTIDRPALQHLLADIVSNRVDTVVVYKVDRLTRSLADFAKIVDIFEANDVTFVSVTQSFNTTTSMGRLTLNMLLSFAQFEREVAGERIRDKIAASKRKGMWMGGHPPLGYDVIDRKLVVNFREAETVRKIFERYIALGTVSALMNELQANGIISKRRTDRHGRAYGGKPIGRGALYAMLQNAIYRGEIRHRDQWFPGQHEAIIDQKLWDDVQDKLARNRVDRKTRSQAAELSLLAGMIRDDAGERMTPSHANKKGTRYRYYVSRSLIARPNGTSAGTGMRLPAGEIEQLVERRLCDFLGDTAILHEELQLVLKDAPSRQVVIEAATDMAKRWPERSPCEKRRHLQAIVERVDVRLDEIAITLRFEGLVAELTNSAVTSALGISAQQIVLAVPASLRRAGKGMRLVINGPDTAQSPEPDPSLLRILGQAHRYQMMVHRGDGASIAELAGQANVDPSYFTRILKLGFLSPAIASKILEGRQPAVLNARRLTHAAGKLSVDWDTQARQLSIE